MKRMYLYLASRSKQGIKLITVLQGNGEAPFRLDLEELQLPQNWERKIQQIIYDNRILYEPWVEPAATYEELRGNLKKRGFTDLAMGANPMLNLPAYSCAPIIRLCSKKPKRRIMIQKR